MNFKAHANIFLVLGSFLLMSHWISAAAATSSSEALSTPTENGETTFGLEFLPYNETGTLYPYYNYNKEKNTIQGPCGKFMKLSKESYDSKYLVCKCKEPENGFCRTRPIMYWEKTKRCYYAFDQGPCGATEWIVYNEHGNVVCEKNRCPTGSPRMDEDDYNSRDYNITFFTHHDRKCHKTDTQAFCANGKEAYFLQDDITPRCIPQLPRYCQETYVHTYSEPLGCPKGTNPQADGGCAQPVSFSG